MGLERFNPLSRLFQWVEEKRAHEQARLNDSYRETRIAIASFLQKRGKHIEDTSLALQDTKDLIGSHHTEPHERMLHRWYLSHLVKLDNQKTVTVALSALAQDPDLLHTSQMIIRIPNRFFVLYIDYAQTWRSANDKLGQATQYLGRTNFKNVLFLRGIVKNLEADLSLKDLVPTHS